MSSNGRTSIVLWVLIACLLVTNGLTLAAVLWQYSANTRQRAETARLQADVDALQGQRQKLLEHAAQGNIPTVRVIPASNPGALAGVKESDIPGRYRWFESEKNRGIITLHADHTFTSLNGQKSETYRWTLSPDQLVMEYNRMTCYYTNVEAPGIYLGVRTDRKSQRLEKVE
jgi:hypothetical protein